MRHTGFVYNRENGLCQLKIPVGTSNLTLFPAETAAFGENTHTHTSRNTHNGSLVCYLSQTLTWKQHTHSPFMPTHTHVLHTHGKAHFWHSLIDVKKPHPPSLLQYLPFFTKQCWLFRSSAALGPGFKSDPDPAELPPIIRLKESDYQVKVQPLFHHPFLIFSELKRGISTARDL